MLKLIGIAGQKQNGKDLLTDCLEKDLIDRVTRVAFADGIKDTLCELFGVTRAWIEEWKEKPEPPPGWNMTVRKTLQFIGDGFRQIKGSIWVDQAARRVEAEQWYRILHVFTDIRYFNELEKTKELNGYVVLVYRPGYLNDIDHPSEALLRPLIKWFVEHRQEGYVSDIPAGAPRGANMIDLFLVNDGTIEDFNAKIRRYLLPKVLEK
jgi:hypothetical protein